MKPRLNIELVAPPKPWSTNDDRKLHWAPRKRLVDAWHEATHYAWLTIPHGVRDEWKGRPCTVRMRIPFPTKRRRDPSNYVGTIVKACVDQLTRDGLWPDDTDEWVTVLQPDLRPGETSAWIILEAR